MGLPTGRAPRWRFPISASVLTTGLHSGRVTQAAVSCVNSGFPGKYAGQNYSTGSSNLVMLYRTSGGSYGSGPGRRESREENPF